MLKNKNCCYCGQPATCHDHITPISYTRKTGKRKTSREHNEEHRRKYTVGSCQECNSLLSNYHLLTISERASYLADRLAQRYKKTLEMPFWSEEELQELGKSLRTTVMRKQLERADVIDRIRHCTHVSNLNMEISDYWGD